MKRTLMFLLLALTASGAFASSLTVDTGTSPQYGNDIFWYGYALYLNDAGTIGIGVPMSGNLSLYNMYNDRIVNLPWTTYGGSWEYYTTSSLDYYMCYYTAMNAATFDRYALGYGNQSCTPPPPLPREEYDLCERRPWAEQCGPICPLLVQTGHGPWSLTGPDDGVLFDMDADGRRERTSWTTPGSSLAFVALDLNHNGRIDDAAELFGEHTQLRDGSKPPNGFVALKEHDDNGDDAIDDNDAIWPFLLLWSDRNHDGISQPTELAPITSSNITSLSTAYRWSGRRDQHGNLLRYAATCEGDSSAPYYDVYLRIER